MAKGFEDFPIVPETYRDCLRDVLDLAHLEEVLGDIGRGEIEVITAETIVPSPVAASLLYDFVNQYMYEWDQPKAERQMQALMMGRELLSQLLDEASLPDLLRPEAVRAVDDRLQYLADGRRARTRRGTGDRLFGPGRPIAGGSCRPQRRRRRGLARSADRCGSTGRHRPARRPPLRPGRAGRRPTVPLLTAPAKSEAESGPGRGRRAILRRVLSTHGPLTRDWLLARYPWEPGWLDDALEALVENGETVTGQILPIDPALIPGLPTEATIATAATWSASTARPCPSCAKRSSRCRSMTMPISWPAGSTSIPPSGCPAPGRWPDCCRRCAAQPAPGIIWERDLLPLRLEPGAFDPSGIGGHVRAG